MGGGRERRGEREEGGEGGGERRGEGEESERDEEVKSGRVLSRQVLCH